jgi:hypothetical protein
MNNDVRRYVMRRRDIEETAKLLSIFSGIEEAVEYLENKVANGLLSEHDSDVIYHKLGDCGPILCRDIESMRSRILGLFK